MEEKRMIDAKSFAEHLERMARTACPNLLPGLLEAAEYAKDFITVDAVEVIRCRDCKYYCQDEIYGEMCRHPELDFGIECYDHWINTKPYDFCSYGEQKDGDGNG